MAAEIKPVIAKCNGMIHEARIREDLFIDNLYDGQTYFRTRIMSRKASF